MDVVKTMTWHGELMQRSFYVSVHLRGLARYALLGPLHPSASPSKRTLLPLASLSSSPMGGITHE